MAEPAEVEIREPERVAVADLRPHPRNYRHHPDSQIDHLEHSLREVGLYRNVVIARDGTILAGHGVVETARRLGVPEVLAVRLDLDPGDPKAMKVLAADNELGRLAVVDDQALAAILQDVKISAFDGLLGTGFDDEAHSALLASLEPPPGPLPPVPDPEEPPEAPRTRSGDLWLLGDHRLLCGDATRREDYERVLNKRQPGAVVTDPPYGVGIGEKNRALHSIGHSGQVLTDLQGDESIKEVEVLWRDAFGAIAQVIPPGCPYYIFGPQGGELGLLLLVSLRDSGLAPRHILIWVKNRASFSIGRLDYDYQHEPIVYGWKPGASHRWFSEATRSSVLAFDRPQASPDHPTTKPVDLLCHLIANSTVRGDVVLDPFGGSGSTLMACDQLGRRACLLEIDSRYVDVTLARYQRLTGSLPVLEATGEPCSFVA